MLDTFEGSFASLPERNNTKDPDETNLLIGPSVEPRNVIGWFQMYRALAADASGDELTKCFLPFGQILSGFLKCNWGKTKQKTRFIFSKLFIFLLFTFQHPNRVSECGDKMPILYFQVCMLQFWKGKGTWAFFPLVKGTLLGNCKSPWSISRAPRQWPGAWRQSPLLPPWSLRPVFWFDTDVY